MEVTLVTSKMLYFLVLVAATLSCGNAFVNFSNVFGDDMILSSGSPGAPVWGWSTPLMIVEFTFSGGFNVNVSSDSSGFWRVSLPPQPSSLALYTLEATVASEGSSAIVSRVLFGIVLFCSGQSNMVRV